MATTTNLTTTYAGESAGKYIGAALLSAPTLAQNAVTVKQNIKYKEVVKTLAATGLSADASCDFTPTGTVDVQCNLWSDIMMMLDVCAPVQNISKSQVHAYMSQTHRRAAMQFDHHPARYDQVKWSLFPIIQWWLYTDLRKESIDTLTPYAIDGIGIGGLSVGETLEEMEEMLAFMAPLLPQHIPRYLMGVWTPESMLLGIQYGIDMFDCVAPTRLGRHGIAYQLGGNSKLTHNKYKWSTSIGLADTCPCHVCKTYSLGYLNHLFNEWEMLGGILLSLHNIAYLHHLCRCEREKILWKIIEDI